MSSFVRTAAVLRNNTHGNNKLHDGDDPDDNLCAAIIALR